MKPIKIRYGESLSLPIESSNVDAESADFYVGKPGEPFTLTVHTDLVLGNGVFVFESDDTKIPLGTYYYQINVTDVDGFVDKFPKPKDPECDDCDEADFPEFVVGEALDADEVS